MALGDNTGMGGASPRFPSTRWSLILEARDRSSPAYREALEELCQRYWKPIYAFVRAVRRLGNEEAKDVTQDFFTELTEGKILSNVAPDRGSFRAYVRGALQHFLANVWHKAVAIKRGGGRRLLRFDDEEVRQLGAASDAPTPDEEFDVQWARAVLEHALGDLEEDLVRTGKGVYHQVFERYELNPPPGEAPTYAQLGEELGIKASDVTNYLTYCRRRLRRLVVDQIREYVDGEDQVGPELAQVFRKASR